MPLNLRKLNTIYEINEAFQADKDGASASFIEMREAVSGLCKNYKKVQDLDKSDKKSYGVWLRYTMSLLRAKQALKAYKKEHDTGHILDKGIRREFQCENALYLLDKLPKISREKISPSKSSDKNMVRVLANAAIEDAEKMTYEPLDNKQVLAMYKTKRDFTKLIKPNDDKGLLTHYLDNRQLLENFKELARRLPEEKAIQELGAEAAIYERYLDVRVEMMSNPVHKILSENQNERFPKTDEEIELFSEIHNVNPRWVERYKLLLDEKKDLLRQGIAEPEPLSKKVHYATGTLGSKDNSLTASLFTAKGVFGQKTSLQKLDLNGKIRLGKLGCKLNPFKYLKLSASVSAGAAEVKNTLVVDEIPMIKDGSAVPEVGAVTEGKAYALKGRAKVVIGSKNNNIFVHPEGVVGYANGKANISFGKHTTKDADGNEKTEYGLDTGYDYKLSAIGGSVDGGFSILGIKFNVRVNGYVGIGSKAGIKATTGALSFTLGAALGIGGDALVSIDWSGFKKKCVNWFRKKSRVTAEKNEEKLRKSFGMSKLDANKLNSQKMRLLLNDGPGKSIGKGYSSIFSSLTVNMREEAVRMDKIAREVMKTAADKTNKLAKYFQKVELASDTSEKKSLLSKLKKLKTTDENFAKIKEAADDAMATTVLANILRVQKEFKLPNEDRLSNAIRNTGHMKQMIAQIKSMNADNKLWDISNLKKIEKAFSAESIKDITLKVMKKSVPEAAADNLENGHNLENGNNIENINNNLITI